MEVPTTIEAAVIVVSAKFAVESAEECMKKGAKYVIMIPGGFNETKTEEGRNKQAKLVSLAHQYNCRIIGPNCMGVFDPSSIDTLFVGEEGYALLIYYIVAFPNLVSDLLASSRNQERLPLRF